MNEMNKRIDSIDFLSEDNNNEISESKNKIELSNLWYIKLCLVLFSLIFGKNN